MLDRAPQLRWAARPLKQRLELLTRARHALAARLDALALCLMDLRGAGRPEVLASEILPLLDAIRFLECEAPAILAERPAPGRIPRWSGDCRCQIHRRPLGRVLILSPGNYPLFLGGVGLFQALAAGNSVLLKPQLGCEAPWPLVLAALDQAGLEAGLVTILPSSIESAQQAITAGVDLVVLTGSVESGRQVLLQAAATLTPSILELSGSDAVLVGPGADLDRVVAAMAWARSLNSGRTCMAPRRLLVDPSCCQILERIPHRRAERGDPGWQDGDISEVLLAAVVTSGEMAEWVELSPYGLGVSLFGSSEWAADISAQLRCGVVVVNDIIAPSADPRLPFGGRKLSGFGTTRGAEGLLAMTAPQAITERRSGPCYHLEPPTRYDAAILENLALCEHAARPRDRVGAAARLLWAMVRYRVSRRRRS